MSDRKFTPPTKFPAEYVDGNGNKAVILGRGPHEVFPFIGHNADGYAASWTKKGKYYPENSTDGPSRYDLHDIPEVTAELEQAEAKIVELEAKLVKAVEALEGMVGLFSADNLLLRGTHLNMELTNARNILSELRRTRR